MSGARVVRDGHAGVLAVFVDHLIIEPGSDLPHWEIWQDETFETLLAFGPERAFANGDEALVAWRAVSPAPSPPRSESESGDSEQGRESSMCGRIENWFIDDVGHYRIAHVHGQISGGSRRATETEIMQIEEQRRHPRTSHWDGLVMDDEG